MYSPSELGIFTDDWARRKSPGRPRALRMCGINRECTESVWSESLTEDISDAFRPENEKLRSAYKVFRCFQTGLQSASEIYFCPPPTSVFPSAFLKPSCRSWWQRQQLAHSPCTWPWIQLSLGLTAALCGPTWWWQTITVLLVNSTGNGKVSPDSTCRELPSLSFLPQKYLFGYFLSSAFHWFKIFSDTPHTHNCP